LTTNADKRFIKQIAKTEHDGVLVREMAAIMKDDAELFKLFMDNDGFTRWMKDTVFVLTYQAEAG
jgi:type I restriction enzyme R subunit